jgi:hypothetical protein
MYHQLRIDYSSLDLYHMPFGSHGQNFFLNAHGCRRCRSLKVVGSPGRLCSVRLLALSFHLF